MKRLYAIILALSIMICGTFALAAAGGISDPFISLSYITDTFMPSILGKAKTTSDNDLSALYDKTIAKVDAITGPDTTGFNYAPEYINLDFNEGGTLEMVDFTSFVLLSGTANLRISRGEVIDLSTGESVPDCSVLKQNRKYFATESTKALIRVYSPSASSVTEGYYIYSNQGTIPPQLRFVDVSETHWANEYITALSVIGAVNGVGDFRFAPENVMTRAMFVTILGRLCGINASDYTTTDFYDVDMSLWYGAHVSWAAENGIVTGYGDGRFGPDDSITREQMAAIIIRYADVTGIALGSNINPDTFSDIDKISQWAKDSVTTAQKAGIITGKPGNLFDPGGTAQRSEVCAVTYRLIYGI